MTSDDLRRGLGTRVQLSERRSRPPIRPIRPAARHVSAAAFSQEISVRSRRLVPANAGLDAADSADRALGRLSPKAIQPDSARKVMQTAAGGRARTGRPSQGASLSRFPPFTSFLRGWPERVAPPGRFRSSSSAKEPGLGARHRSEAAPPAANPGGLGT
jgi:hypothetical protein